MNLRVLFFPLVLLSLPIALLGVFLVELPAQETPAATTEAADAAPAADARAETPAESESQSTAPLVDTAADEEAIRANVAKFIEAFNRRDSRTIASQWSPDAIYIDSATGQGIVGREAIADSIDYDFAGLEDAELSVDIESIEFLSPNVAIEKGLSTVKFSEYPTDVSTYSVVHVKRDGKWYIDRVTEELLPPPPVSNYEHLQELEWLLGTWVDQSEDATVETECNWTKNKNFMTRAFAVKLGDEIDVSGMQVIGWDAAEKQIRSWVFDSEGGFAEATWTKNEESWVIQSAGTLPTGEKSSATNILTRVDDDSFTWQSTERQVGGELQPNLPEVLIVRAPTEETADDTAEAE